MTLKIILLAGGISALAIAGALFFFQKPQEVKVPAGVRAGDLIIKPATLNIKGSTYQADNGILVVPENRADPASRLIALPVLRIHAASADAGEPIFHLAGGPGISNMKYRPPAWLLEKHDLVLVGYRGVDGTPRLDSPEFAEAVRGKGADLLSAKSLDALGESIAACAARLQADGTDLEGYTIAQVVWDMEAARQALGYKHINLLSESFGTRIAQIYAYIHPSSLKRSAMIGVNPPGHLLWLPETVDSQVEYYSELWRKSAGPAAPDIVGAMRRVNAKMPAAWLFFPIDPGKVRVISFVMLYHRTTAPLIFDAYLSADSGDPGGLALMSLAYDFLMPNMMTWGEFLALGVSTDGQPGRDYRAELSSQGAILGSPLALLVWGSAAGKWPPILMAEEYRRTHVTDVETLLISGSIDFSTPPTFAEKELLPVLKNGRHVVISEQGHTEDFWRFQRGAAERLLTSFYDTGNADDSLYTYLPMIFKPAFRFSTIIKIVLCAGVALLAGVLLAALLIIRRASVANPSHSRL